MPARLPRAIILILALVGLFLTPGLGNKADHEKLMANGSTAKKVRVGVHNKLSEDILVFDHTHDHGKESQRHLEPMAVIKPGELFHWFTLEGRFFRLLPGHDSEWHGEGVHVVTSGVGAAGRNFEIGERNREEIERLYPPDVYAEDDEMHRALQTYNIETVVYEHEHEL